MAVAISVKLRFWVRWQGLNRYSHNPVGIITDIALDPVIINRFQESLNLLAT